MSEDRVRQIQLRIGDNPLGRILKRYTAYLVGRGHAAVTCDEYGRVAEHFGRWLGRRPLSQASVRQFISRHLSVCRCPMSVIRSITRNRWALNHLLAMFGIEAAAAVQPCGFVHDLLRCYAARLTKVQGLAAGTVHKRVRVARKMFARLRVKQRSHLASWTPQRIVNYVSSEGSRYTLSTANDIACAARSLLRFLLQEGWIQHDLATAVPSFAHWRLASLPETLQDDELVRLINAADVRTSIGLRDRAIVLCLSEMGLRASEVACLAIDGIDFASDTLSLRRSKQGRFIDLPMPSRVARALAVYLQRGRPACTSRIVFVLHRPPVGKPISPATVKDIVGRLAERAKLGGRISGAHVLRHSFASRMLRAGASLKQIADLLGHRSIDTTTIYAKVDLKSLSQVALPWPGSKDSQR